jgi:hypothetical protein
MSQGSPAPLLATDVLTAILPLVHPGGLTGAWLRGCRRLLRLRSAGRSLLVCSDLGVLLRRCNLIAIRHGKRVVVVDAERLIAWRTLRIVTGATELPGVEQLRRLIPRLEARGSFIDVPIGLGGPEKALAACMAVGVPVVASSITYRD